MTVCQNLTFKVNQPVARQTSLKKGLKEMTKDKTQSRFNSKLTYKLQNYFKVPRTLQMPVTNESRYERK